MAAGILGQRRKGKEFRTEGGKVPAKRGMEKLEMERVDEMNQKAHK